MGIPSGTAKRYLASLRREILEGQRKRTPEITDDEKRFGVRLAREWQAEQRKIERVEKLIERIQDKQIAKSRDRQKKIEKDVRSLGGIERFSKML